MDHEAIIARSWSTEDLRKRQTELTKTINTLRKQADWFKGYVSESEKKEIESAIATFTRLRDLTAHAKEVQVRKDKRHESDKKRSEAAISQILTGFLRDNKTRYLMAFCHELEGLPNDIKYIIKLTNEDQEVSRLNSALKNLSGYFVQKCANSWRTYFVSHEDYKNTFTPRPLNSEEVLKLLNKEFAGLPSDAHCIADQLDDQIAKMEAIEQSSNVTRLSR